MVPLCDCALSATEQGVRVDGQGQRRDNSGRLIDSADTSALALIPIHQTCAVRAGEEEDTFRDFYCALGREMLEVDRDVIPLASVCAERRECASVRREASVPRW